uniref:Uncharacterized protein n=1 Tax=Heterorhabditis bacteriophora TaxID=37862 RepID=A0A1I7WZA9_HETBA
MISRSRDTEILSNRDGWHLGTPDSRNLRKYPVFPKSRSPENPVTRHFSLECQPNIYTVGSLSERLIVHSSAPDCTINPLICEATIYLFFIFYFFYLNETFF